MSGRKASAILAISVLSAGLISLGYLLFKIAEKQGILAAIGTLALLLWLFKFIVLRPFPPTVKKD